MIPKAPGKVAHEENGEFLLLTPEEHRAIHGMNKEGNFMTTITATQTIERIKNILENENRDVFAVLQISKVIKEYKDNVKEDY